MAGSFKHGQADNALGKRPSLNASHLPISHMNIVEAKRILHVIYQPVMLV